MTLKELIEEFQKLPPQTQLQDVRVEWRYSDRQIVAVKWQGTHTQLEVE